MPSHIKTYQFENQREREVKEFNSMTQTGSAEEEGPEIVSSKGDEKPKPKQETVTQKL